MVRWPSWESTPCSYFSIPAILLWLRWLERRDSSHDAPQVDERDTARDDAARGLDRAEPHGQRSCWSSRASCARSLIRAGHLGLGLLLRVTATDGYLGSMRTVHFAHWAFLNNGSRLHVLQQLRPQLGQLSRRLHREGARRPDARLGQRRRLPADPLPRLDGASHGRQFKTWALALAAVSRFWYSAYRDFTVDQIERTPHRRRPAQADG